MIYSTIKSFKEYLHQVGYAMEFADRVIGIHAGRVVFEGRPDTLDTQALARIYPGLEGIAQTQDEFEGVAQRLAELAS